MDALGLRAKQSLWRYDARLKPRRIGGRRVYNMDRVRALAGTLVARRSRRRSHLPAARRQEYSDARYGTPPISHPLRTGDVSEMLGVSRSTVHRLDAALQPLFVGGARAYAIDEVRRVARSRSRRNISATTGDQQARRSVIRSERTGAGGGTSQSEAA